MLQERGYALENKSGYYVHDPVLGLVLAKAIEMGIQLVAYEAPYGTDDTTIPDAREEIQAENLYQRIYIKDSTAKAFIYCGYGHGLRSWPNGKKMMGERLINRPGSDKRVLSIDQVSYSLVQGKNYPNGDYGAFLATNPTEPAMGFDDSGKVWLQEFCKNRYDGLIFHPPYQTCGADLRGCSSCMQIAANIPRARFSD